MRSLRISSDAPRRAVPSSKLRARSVPLQCSRMGTFPPLRGNHQAGYAVHFKIKVLPVRLAVRRRAGACDMAGHGQHSTSGSNDAACRKLLSQGRTSAWCRVQSCPRCRCQIQTGFAPVGRFFRISWLSHPIPFRPALPGRTVARPLTTESSMEGGAISTTGRRSTARPCNLSRDLTQPAALRVVVGAEDGMPSGFLRSRGELNVTRQMRHCPQWRHASFSSMHYTHWSARSQTYTLLSNPCAGERAQPSDGSQRA